MLAAFEKKYEVRNPVMAAKALSYFKDIHYKDPIHLLHGKFTWPIIEQRLTQMIKFPVKIFPPISINIKKEKRPGHRL